MNSFPGLYIQNRDTQIHPGHAKGNRRRAFTCNRDVGDGKVSTTVKHLANHPVPDTRTYFTAVLNNIKEILYSVIFDLIKNYL